MENYSFRIRFTRSPRGTIEIGASSCEVPAPWSPSPIVLSAPNKEKTIKEATDWILMGTGWGTEQEAFEAGRRCQDALMLSLARLHIGADFGARAPKVLFTHVGDEGMEQKAGRTFLYDVHGLLTFGERMDFGLGNLPQWRA